MRLIRSITIGIALCLSQSAAVHAQDQQLPAFAYDMVAEVTFATTADAQCDGIKIRPVKLQNYIVDMYKQLGTAGVSATDAAKHFESTQATSQITARDGALRTKHGVAAEGIDALCMAIRAEAKVNRPFGKLMRISG